MYSVRCVIHLQDGKESVGKFQNLQLCNFLYSKPSSALTSEARVMEFFLHPKEEWCVYIC